jgi:hypothetical protein
MSRCLPAHSWCDTAGRHHCHSSTHRSGSFKHRMCSSCVLHAERLRHIVAAAASSTAGTSSWLSPLFRAPSATTTTKERSRNSPKPWRPRCHHRTLARADVTGEGHSWHHCTFGEGGGRLSRALRGRVVSSMTLSNDNQLHTLDFLWEAAVCKDLGT